MIRVSCAFKISEIFSGLVAAFRLQIITPVQNPSATHIGEGEPPIVLEEIRRKWTGLEVIFRKDDISKPTDWQILDRRHVTVVHLGGHMQRLETELDGFGGSYGPALPGEVWTVPAGRKYASHACGAAIRYAVLLAEPDAPDAIVGTKNGRTEIAALAGVRDEFLYCALRKLHTVARNADDISAMRSQSLIQGIYLHLFRTLGLAETRHLKPQGSPLLNAKAARQLREFIFDRMGEQITLADLAKLAGVTTHHLLIAFRKAFGRTPAQYIIQQRLRHAQRQLANTKKDITTIAIESGFSSHSHLTACFHKHLGTCPSAFRKTVHFVAVRQGSDNS